MERINRRRSIWFVFTINLILLTKFIKNAEERHIGPEQMSTDNAVYTVKQIAGGKKFSDLKYKDKEKQRIKIQGLPQE